MDIAPVRKFLENLRPSYRWKQEVLRMSDAKVWLVYREVLREAHKFWLRS